jgi:hypothetical protein
MGTTGRLSKPAPIRRTRRQPDLNIAGSRRPPQTPFPDGLEAVGLGDTAGVVDQGVDRRLGVELLVELGRGCRTRRIRSSAGAAECGAGSAVWRGELGQGYGSASRSGSSSQADLPAAQHSCQRRDCEHPFCSSLGISDNWATDFATIPPPPDCHWKISAARDAREANADHGEKDKVLAARAVCGGAAPSVQPVPLAHRKPKDTHLSMVTSSFP